MNAKQRIVLFFTLLLCGVPFWENAIGQTYRESAGKIIAPNSVFGELVGQGLGFSVNYDRLLLTTPGKHNLALRLGLGHILVGYSIPFTASYLFGHNNKLELGAGWVYTKGEFFERFSEVTFIPFIGYRYQRPVGGWMFRIGFTPLFDTERIFPYGGLSFGRSF